LFVYLLLSYLEATGQNQLILKQTSTDCLQLLTKAGESSLCTAKRLSTDSAKQVREHLFWLLKCGLLLTEPLSLEFSVSVATIAEEL